MSQVQKILSWLMESGVLERCDTVTVTITKDAINVQYKPPLIEVSVSA